VRQLTQLHSDTPLSTQAPIRVAVIGTGAFGRNHARVYGELQQEGLVELVGVVDANAERARSVAATLNVPAFASVDELLASARPQAASVAVPTVAHLEVSRRLLAAGLDLLIEKPLASSLAQADELIALAERHQRVVQVGHLERFNPAVRATVPLLTQPMFFEVHRLSMFGPRALDVDVVLDLMIHDIDVVLSFAQSPVKEIRAVGLPILSNKVDIASVRLEFESGCVANLTASRISTERVRKLRFFQPRQYVSVDYTRQDILVFTVDHAGAAVAALAAMGMGRPGAAPAALPPELMNSLVRPSKPPVEPQEPLRAELSSFIAAVRGRSRPVVSLEDGRRALAVALDILEAIRQHGERVHLDRLWSAPAAGPR
jgi:predicted dehydrogenase